MRCFVEVAVKEKTVFQWKMTYFTSWEEFAKAVEKLHSVNSEKCRLVAFRIARALSFIVFSSVDCVFSFTFSAENVGANSRGGGHPLLRGCTPW